MRSRRLTWILLSLLCLAGAWLLWQRENGRDGWPSRPHRPREAVASAVRPYPGVASGHSISTNAAQISLADWNTNKFAGRLSNTARSLDQLMRDDKAILLENALIDTRTPLNFVFPKNLQSQGDPGAYIVQANGPIDNAFRAMLKAAGATIVSYIPNNAYLVRAPAGVANGLGANPLTQSAIPYEPYYKISSSMPVTVGQKMVSSAPMKTHRAAGPSLLALAVKQAPLPAGTCLTLGLFSDNAAATVAQIKKLGGQIFAQDRSPFGPIVRVQPPQNWTALAALPGVQIVEPYHKRIHANDLSRATVGVSTDTLTPTNYMNLTGSNVMVEVNDSGIDATHPDFTTGGSAANGPGGAPIRVIGDAVQSLVDTNGHGTHVAGIIAGNGAMSIKPVNVGSVAEGSVSNADFRGKAPLATLYSVGGIKGGSDTNVITDEYLQETPAQTNALISNNSWGYGGDNVYDLAAASYDAATRDALPEVTGSQPVLFVFAAGNDGYIGQNGGNGDNNGGGGTPDTISSPGTAKNVITVGALEQLRNITNIVTDLNGNSNAVWQPETDTGYQVAGYSSRGNVGVGIEGAFGRLKPDVVAPGTFVVSTRSAQWATNAYYNPTNYDDNIYTGQLVGGNSVNYYSIFVPQNAISVTIQIVPNNNSPNPFPTNMPIYVSQYNYPDPTDPNTYDFTTNDEVLIPPDGPGDYLTKIQGTGFNFAVGNNSSQAINYDLFTEVITTNDLGNYYQVLEGMNDSLGGYYRYETGTSMAAADVSGVLALMQDFFTNQWQTLPSPALLKAMLINGARPTLPSYNMQVNSAINYEGWGLINLPNSLLPGIITNQVNVPCSAFIQDQSPTNALATGDSQTFYVSVTDTNAQLQPLRITLAWTDPPGNPAAAIKLVNDLVLVVTNFSDPTNPIVYYGNDISENGFNTPENPTNTVNVDSINNIQNVIVPQPLGSNYIVTVMGYRVNVNAVTAQTNDFFGNYAPNVVQDYALVISSGDGSVTNAMTVTTNSPINPGAPSFVSNLTNDQQITYVSGNSGPLINQFVGASTPLMGTNTLLLTNLVIASGETNEQITIGMTNQWHFYVVTNSTTNVNAAFVTYGPDTLSIPRMGVFADSQSNATMPEADIDLWVTTDSNLLTLNPTSIYNAATNALASVVGPTPNTFATAGGIYEMAALGSGGTKYVVDTNSQPGEVYYVGVQSEDQMASEYDFLSVFSATPFSQMQNGNEIVTGVGVPVAIPNGNPAVPGYTDVVAIAIYPIQARCVVVNDTFYAEDLGDLVGAVNHNGTSVILNNHTLPVNGPGTYSFIYDDSGQGDIANSQPSDGPGSLNSFIGQDGTGVWILHEADNAVGFSDAVESFNSMIEPHLANNGTTIFVTISNCQWYSDYIDVPPGATNLTITVTNLTGSPEYPGTESTVDLYEKYGSPPTTNSNSFDKMATITPPATVGTISIGPTDVPPLTSGVYYYGVYVPCSYAGVSQTVSITVTYSGPAAVPVDFTSVGATPILDDAVTTNSIFVPDNAVISSVDVGLQVDHPRVSDLVFHLISPDGTRVLLMENRGGTTTNGIMEGDNYLTTNAPQNYIINGSHTGKYNGTITDIIPTGGTMGNIGINYDFGGIPTTITVYYGSILLLETNILTNPGTLNHNYGPGASTITVIIQQSGPTNCCTPWNYSINLAFWPASDLLYGYLVLTENTNLTTTPIKFAPTPFMLTNAVPVIPSDVVVLQGPVFNLANGHAYYLLGTNTWTGSEHWAEELGGHLATIRNVNENTWIVYTFSFYNSTFYPNLWIGLYDPSQDTNCSPYSESCHSSNFDWVSGDTSTYRNWSPGEPNNETGYYTVLENEGLLFSGWFDADDTNSGALANGIVEVTNLPPPNPDLYYLPEQSLDAFAGKNAGGPWTLEIQDDRAGAATNPAPTLVSWQLRFTFANSSTPVPTIINTNSAFTNFIAPGGIAYYLVEVPTTASYATNILLFASAPVNVWFDTNTPPTTNVFLFGGTSDSVLLSTTNAAIPQPPPNIYDGQIYYLGVQNTNSVTVNYGLEVDFDNAMGIWGLLSISAANITSSGAQLQWAAPSDAEFQVEWATSLSQPMVWMTNATPITSSNGIFMFTDPSSTNSPARFYRLLQLP